MFANILALPFVTAALVVLYLAWEVDSAYALWMVPFVVTGAIIYLFAPQINWWWYTRRPPEMKPALRALLERYSAFYQNLDENGRKRFRDRIELYKMGTDWMPMAWEDDALPNDVKAVLAAHCVMLTWNMEDFLLSKFERIIVYPYPFPTPNYAFAHASETHKEDGCILFSAEQVMRAFLEPGAWYQVALHEYGRAYTLSYPEKDYPQFDHENVWDKLEAASGMPKEHIDSLVGIPVTLPLPVAIHHYFRFPDGFREHLPEAAEAFDKIFKVRD